MKRIGWIAVSTGMALIIGGGVQITRAEDQNGNQSVRQGRRCNEATVRGAWGIQIQGVRPAGPNLPLESVIGVVTRTYNGEGSFTQVDNVKGSTSGIVPDRPGNGTYQVNEDCTMLANLLLPGPPFSIEERIVIVDDGNEMRGITTAPAPVLVSSVHRRIHSR